MKKTLLLLSLFTSTLALAQNARLDSLLFRAMQSELQRGMTLNIPKMSAPFFISYTVQDAERMSLQATLGAITYSHTRPQRSYTTRLLTGSYAQSNELYEGGASDYSGSATIDSSCTELRRALWLGTDALYKYAAEQLAKKQAAIQQRNLPEDEKNLPDFSQEKVARVEYPNAEKMPEQAGWEATLREVSGVFGTYPDISSSSVAFDACVSNIYLVSSEGARVKMPLNFATFDMSIALIQPDGKRLYSSRSYVAQAADKLPAAAQLKADAQKLANDLLAVSRAPKHNEAYSGPVIFEGEALSNLLMARLFEGSQALFALRSPVTGTRPKTLDDKMNKKIIATPLSVKNMPALRQYKQVELVGSYAVDAEAVAPPDSILLVENGMLRALLNDRIPAKQALHSTGSSRLGYRGTALAAPGVVKVEATGKVSRDSLKRKLIEMAKAEGFEYTYIVREMSAGGRPFLLYRVDVKTGVEELVQAAELGALPLSKLKRIAGISDEEMVENFSFNGAPCSLIAPAAMIVEDVDIDKERESSKTKPPVVENPVKAVKEKAPAEKGKKSKRKTGK